MSVSRGKRRARTPTPELLGSGNESDVGETSSPPPVQCKKIKTSSSSLSTRTAGSGMAAVASLLNAARSETIGGLKKGSVRPKAKPGAKAAIAVCFCALLMLKKFINILCNRKIFSVLVESFF